ncbi:MAG TPA: hypothetical protein VHM31_05390 [Polyangia bacterium]|nr:hypothetical protein [Polyangia bacterium]
MRQLGWLALVAALGLVLAGACSGFGSDPKCCGPVSTGGPGTGGSAAGGAGGAADGGR